MSRKLIFGIIFSLLVGFLVGGQFGFKLISEAEIAPKQDPSLSPEEVQLQEAKEFMMRFSEAAYRVGSSRRATYSLYLFQDSYNSLDGIKQSERMLDPVMLAEDLRRVLSPFFELQGIGYIEAQSPGRYYLRVKVTNSISAALMNAPLYTQQAVFYCLSETLRSVPLLHGFQMCNSRGEVLDASYGLFSMEEPYDFSVATMQQPHRGPSQLTEVQQGEEVTLIVYASQYVISNNRDDFSIEQHMITASGESLEEMTLRAYVEPHPLAETCNLSLQRIYIHDGIAYVHFSINPDKMSSMGSAGASEFYDSVYGNLRQFSQITHVQLLFNGGSGGLHNRGSYYPELLR